MFNQFHRILCFIKFCLELIFAEYFVQNNQLRKLLNVLKPIFIFVFENILIVIVILSVNYYI